MRQRRGVLPENVVIWLQALVRCSDMVRATKDTPSSTCKASRWDVENKNINNAMNL